MSNLEKVHELMDVISKQKKAAGHVLEWDGPSKRLVVKPANQPPSPDAVPLGVEDMKVALGKGCPGWNPQKS
jgi:hypothetical protein